MAEHAVDTRPGLRVGVIGLGVIGSGVVRSLANTGVRAIGYDIAPERADGLSCSAAASPAALARGCDVVLVCVVDAAQARTVLFGAEGVVHGARPDLVVGLISTVSPTAWNELGATAARAGLRLVDTPVTGGQHAASNGLVVMFGADDDTASRLTPALHAFARAVIHCGPPGAGLAAKLVRQITVFGSWKVMHDAASFARAVGVDYRVVKEIVRQADPDGSTLPGLMGLRGDTLDALPAPKRAEMRRYYDLMVKDIAAVRELGEAHGIRLPEIERLATDPGPAMYGLTNGDVHD